MSQTYDTKCWELARYFLTGEDGKEPDADQADRLADVIQQVIEDFLSMEAQEDFPERK
jgi:hypothetical protein